MTTEFDEQLSTLQSLLATYQEPPIFGLASGPTQKDVLAKAITELEQIRTAGFAIDHARDIYCELIARGIDIKLAKLLTLVNMQYTGGENIVGLEDEIMKACCALIPKERPPVVETADQPIDDFFQWLRNDLANSYKTAGAK